MIVNVLAAVPLAVALVLIASVAYDAARDWALRRCEGSRRDDGGGGA